MPGLSIDEINFFKEGNINVYSTDRKYAALTGTSQAAAIVTAGIAKLWSNFPELNAAKIIEATKYTGEPVSGNYLSKAVGYGAVNFANAYNYLENEEYLITQTCPAQWDEHKSYEQGDSITFAGVIYEARYKNENDSPATYRLNEGTWQQSNVCTTVDNELNENSNETETTPNTTYELNIETIGVTYYCNSYFLNCGGGNFGGWGGVNFGAGAGSGSRGSSGEGGGGGSSKSTSDKEETEDEKKKKAEQRDKEYKDIKDRADAPSPKQKPGESKEAYNKRLSKHYDKLAEDIKKWDDKWQPGRHAKKIKQIKNIAKNHRQVYERAVKHREVKNKYQNQREKEKSQCKGSGRGIAKVITGIVCRIK